MKRHFVPASMLIALCSLLAGCAAIKAHDNARNEVRPGGIIDQRTQQSLNRRGEIVKERENLGDQKINVENELQRMEKRIAAAQDDARKQDQQLAEAQADQRVSRQRIAELQERQRSLKAELAAMDQQQRSNPRPSPDPARESEKLARLNALKQKQATLQADLDLARSVRR